MGSESVSDIQGEIIWGLWQRVREQGPLVHNITNLVSMQIMADSLLAAGASPIMIHEPAEIDDIVGKVGAVNINIGTLDMRQIKSFKRAAHKASKLGTPWTLDPVGVGATRLRQKVVEKLVKQGPTVLRGNPAEIMFIAGQGGASKGVDSSSGSNEALEAAKTIASTTPCKIVAVTGEVDYVTDGKRVLSVSNGVPMLQQITATGCTVTSLIAAFIAANPEDMMTAAAAALAVFGLAAERGLATAGRKAPGTLKEGLVDYLALLSKEEVCAGVAVKELAK